MANNETLTVKKIPFYLFLILLGFLAFYVYDKVKNKDSMTSVPTQAGPISEKTANEYLNNYLSYQDSLGEAYKLITEKGQTLRGFWLSKETLKSIDSAIKVIDKGADIVGYSIYFGKPVSYRNDKRQLLNLVVRGTVPSKGTNTSQKRTISLGDNPPSGIVDTAGYYDSVDPCPNRCGAPPPPPPPTPPKL